MPAINTLMVFEHGDESLLTCQLDNGGSAGAWVDGSWSFDIDDLAEALTVYADGVPVEGVAIIKKTSPDNDIEAWPMISDYDDGVTGNTIEFWIVHDLIDRDAAVTFDLDAEILTQSASGNLASSGDSATNNSTYKADAADQLDSDAEVCFYNPSTSDPVRMPRAIDSLGTPDGSWNDGDTIPGSSIPFGECVLTIELQFNGYDSGAEYEGCVFEYGDASAGISFAFETDHRMRFRCGNTTDSIEIEERVDFPSVTYFVQGATYEVTFHIQPAANRVDLYFEGAFIERFSGTIGDWSTTSAGAVGQVNGVHFAHSASAGIPGVRSSTWDIITGLRHWDGGSPTIEFTANSKAYFPVEVKDTLFYEDLIRGETVIYDEWSKYFYAKSDFADIRLPGTVFEVNDMQFVWEWYRDSTSRGGNGNPAHGAVLLKSGETLGLERKDHCNDYPSRNGGGILPGIDGESRVRPFVVMRYGGTDPITINLTASDATLYRDLMRHQYSHWILEERILDVHCSTSYNGQHGIFEIDGNETVRQTRIGGYRVQDCPLRPIGFRAETMNGTEDNYGITIGEMSILRGQRGGANGSLFGRGAHDPYDGGIQRVQVGRSLWHNEYDPTSSHVHNMYFKGRMPYLHIKGGWVPTGPGTVIKNDGNERSVFRDFVAWKRQNGGGFSHNGNSSLYGTSVDRSEASGNAAFSRKCFWVDCVITDIDDYTMGVTASIDCEYENCVYWSNIDQNAFYVQCNGSSDQEAEGFSDSHRVGAYNCTLFMNSGIECEVPLTDDRSLVDSLGAHGVYWAECLFVNFAGTSRAMVRWTNDSVDDGVSLGRFEEPRFRRCHFANRGTGDFMDDGGTAYATLAAADAGISEPMFDECNEGVVMFDDEPAATEPVLEYFIDQGYADEDAVIAAIDAAYFNGWDSLADELKIESIFSHFAIAVRATNLNASNTGGSLPGVRSGTLNNQNILVDQAPDDGTINLGNVVVGSVQTVPLNIRNNGQQPASDLTLGALSVSAGASLTVDPSLAVIAAGSSEAAEITIDTAAPGARAITLQIPSDDPDNAVYTITINATVLSVQDIAVDEAAHNGSIDLDSVALGAATSVDLTIRNAAQTPGSDLALGVLSVTAGGAITTNPSNQTIAAGATLVATISVDTATVGARSIDVVIPSDDPDTPAYTITIDASVVGAELQVTLDGDPVLDGGQIEFDGLIESTHATITLDLINAGMADLTLGTIMTSGNLSITANGNPSGEVLAPLDTVSLEVLIDTSVVGAVSGSVSVPSSDPDSPWDVTAQGVVAASANPSDDYTGPDTTQQYLNVAEADAIIALYLIGAHTFRQAWQSLSADDKLVSIAHATVDFNAIPWDGRKVDLDQPNAFPREDRYGDLILPGGEVQYPPSLGGGEWSYPSLPREIRIGVALQAAARAADQLEIDQTMKITGLAAQGITSIGGAGTSWATDGKIARQPSSRLHESVRRLVHKYLRTTAEIV